LLPSAISQEILIFIYIAYGVLMFSESKVCLAIAT